MNIIQLNLLLKAQSKYLSLQCDGWSNIRNEGIINFIICTPKPYFISSVETVHFNHTSDYITEQIEKVINKYDNRKFIAIITDNAANMLKARKSIEDKFPHIVSLNCIAHSLHLIISDLLKCNSVSTFITEVVDIVKAIKKSQILNAHFDSIRQINLCSKTLTLPVKTRWGSNLFCLTSMKVCKMSLQTLAVHPVGSTMLGSKRKQLILDDAVFWTKVDKLIDIMNPIVKWITILEGDSITINQVFDAFYEIKNNFSDSFSESHMTIREEKIIVNTFKERHLNTIKPLHLAASLLDPKTQGCNLSNSEVLKSIEFIDQMISAQNNLSDSYKMDASQILADIANYRTRQDIWSNNFIWKCVEKVTPLTWWNSFCSSTNLCVIANKVLSVPATSAATERSFSTFSNIHTKKRNRLTTSNASKITFVAHYWRQTAEKNKKVNYTEPEVEPNEIDENTVDLSKISDESSMSSNDSTSSNEVEWKDSDDDFFDEYLKQKD